MDPSSLPFFESTLFSSSEKLSGREIQARIEVLALGFLSDLVGRTTATIQMPCNTRRNRMFSVEEEVRLGKEMQTRSLKRNPKGFMRVLCVLDFVHRLVVHDKIASQRSLFYSLIQFFDTQDQSNRTIGEISRILQCPRLSLRIFADEKGSVIGCVSLKCENGQWINCEDIGPRGKRITQLDKYIEVVSRARCILVVEKDAVFQRLAEDKIFAHYPCIMVTARGMPDLATRDLLRFFELRLDLPIYVLVDYNPGGLEIYLTYRTGSMSKGIESYEYAIKAKFLGLLEPDVKSFPVTAGIPLTTRDQSKLNSLLSHPLIEKYDALKDYVTQMQNGGKKYEIEAVYGSGGLEKLLQFVIFKLIRHDFLPF